MSAQDVPHLHFILKVASRCNLNCSYCYVYNMGDNTWRQRPKVMSNQVFSASVHRILNHCKQSDQCSVTITLHGGEPCLAGTKRVERWLQELQETISPFYRLNVVMQTNGTLLNPEWAALFRRYNVGVGISIDGPQALHDVARVDHRGRGSHERVLEGIDVLRAYEVPFSVLCVVQPGAPGLEVHEHLCSLRPVAIDYLLPDATHDGIGSSLRLGPTPCADYLIPIFDTWCSSWPGTVHIRLFWNIARLILGGVSETDIFGNAPFQFVFVEPDGSIEGLDVLRVCRNGMSRTSLNVFMHDFLEIAGISTLHREAIFRGTRLPAKCATCVESSTCAGGYLPHRYSTDAGFNNPSVWCGDLMALFEHARNRFGVSVAETAIRRRALNELADDFRAITVAGAHAQ